LWIPLRLHFLLERRPQRREAVIIMTASTLAVVSAAFALLAGCNNQGGVVTTPAAGVDIARGKFMNDEILEWLKEAPFDDPERAGLNPNFSYDEWFARGKSIPGSVDALVALLNSEDPLHPSGLGARAAYALGWVGDTSKPVVDALLRSLNSKDPGLRIEAVSALGRQGSADVLPILVTLLTNENEDVNVRANACIAIGRLRVPSSEPLLRRILQDKNAFLVRSAQEALRLLKEQ
jgi:hypothetical protein